MKTNSVPADPSPGAATLLVSYIAFQPQRTHTHTQRCVQVCVSACVSTNGCELATPSAPCFFFFKRFYLFIFRERRREGEREGEKHQCVVASHEAPTGDLPHNPVMCSDWELNQQPFGVVRRLTLNPRSHTSQGCTLLSSLTCLGRLWCRYKEG